MKLASVRDLVLIYDFIESMMKNSIKAGDTNSKMLSVLAGLMLDAIERIADREGDKAEFEGYREIRECSTELTEPYRNSLKQRINENPEQAINELAVLYTILRKKEGKE